MAHFRAGTANAEADDLIGAFHYSRRLPGNIQFIGTWHEDGGLFGDFGSCIAAAYWSIPPTRWADSVLELSRLVRRNDAKISLTGLIAACCDQLRRTRGADLLVSFADPQHGHHGGVYQAASWNYDGQRGPACDGILLDGVFIPGRSCNSRWGTRSPDKLREIMPSRSIEPHFDTGKHLYWRALTKAGRRKASKLGLQHMPYPKPARALEAA